MKKLALTCAVALSMASCTSMKLVDQNAALNAGAAAVQALTISDAQVAQLCSQYMVESDGQNTVLPANNDYTKRLDRIMSKFRNISNLNLNYKVYQSKEVNAFASGDGSVRVYTGLMDVMSDDELFAVVGHELGHLINKDVRDAYRTAYLVVAARYGIAAVNTRNFLPFTAVKSLYKNPSIRSHPAFSPQPCMITHTMQHSRSLPRSA